MAYISRDLPMRDLELVSIHRSFAGREFRVEHGSKTNRIEGRANIMHKTILWTLGVILVGYVLGLYFPAPGQAVRAKIGV